MFNTDIAPNKPVTLYDTVSGLTSTVRITLRQGKILGLGIDCPAQIRIELPKDERHNDGIDRKAKTGRISEADSRARD